MVTGIEAAGLVLGTFPLAIEAIKIYCNGVQTVKDMVKYQEILSMFQYEISVEDFFFRQTLKSLLEENLPKSDIERLMNDPGGELWKSVNIQAGLQELLQGDEAVNHFLKTATLLRETLQDVARKFDKVSHVSLHRSNHELLQVGGLANCRQFRLAKRNSMHNIPQNCPGMENWDGSDLSERDH